ncbi:hypothetical protein LINPERPRIM_LOCUS22070 [Linum perenne]
MEKGESSARPQRSWADIISDPKDDLQFVDISESAKQGGALRLPDEVLAKGVEKLKAAVVVQFLGNPPPIRVFANVANQLWGYEGGVIISSLDVNFFLVEFNSVKLCDWVLSRSWHIHNTGMIMRRWARGIKPVVIDDGHVPEWITFQKVPPAAVTIEGISWLLSLIGKPLRKFVREGLDIKVCIIRDRAIPCPEAVKLIDVDEEHVIQVVQAKARDYKREVRKQIYVPKIKIGAEVKATEDDQKGQETKEDEMVDGEKKNDDKDVEDVVNEEAVSKSAENKETHTPEGDATQKMQSTGGKKKRPKRKKKSAKKKLESALSTGEVEESADDQHAKGNDTNDGNEPASSMEGTGSPEEVSVPQGIETEPDKGSPASSSLVSQLHSLSEELRLKNGEISKWSSDEESVVNHTVRKANLGDFMQHCKHVKKKYLVSGVKTRYKNSLR